jgi:hypothetical protein
MAMGQKYLLFLTNTSPRALMTYKQAENPKALRPNFCGPDRFYHETNIFKTLCFITLGRRGES